MPPSPSQQPDQTVSADPTQRWLQRIVAAFALLLFAETWRLWTLQADFPQVPLPGWGANLPPWFDWLVLVGLLGSLGVAVAFRAESRLARGGWLAFVGCLIVLVIGDQHRLQPWAYQFGLMALAFGTLPARCGLVWVRVLVVSIYVFSALSKLDVAFCDTLGQRFLEVLLPRIGLSMSLWSEAAKRGAAMMFPAFELLVGTGLCWSRTRRVALVASIAMHALMLFILGPWGLNHRPGVLLWNGFFVVQNVMLFWKRDRADCPSPAAPLPQGERGDGPSSPERCPLEGAASPPLAPAAEEGPGVRGERSRMLLAWMTHSVLSLAVVAPLLEPWGLCDNWIAWGLYAVHGDRTAVFVHEAAIEKLPARIREHAVAEPAAAPWVRVKIDRWSLATLDAPIYPAPRFETGVALALADAARLNDDELRIRFEGPADRWTSRRESSDVTGLANVRSAASAFWLNALPRGKVTP